MNPPNYRILWIDPGKISGWATYSAFKVANEYTDEMWTCGYLGPEKHNAALELLIENQSVMDYTVGYEDFLDTNNRGAITISKKYIAVIEHVVEVFNDSAALQWKLVHQVPSQAKVFVSDGKLEALGILNKPASKKPNTDMNDAYRHIVYYMINTLHRRDLLRRWHE